MTLDEAKKAMVKFVELKTTLRPAFVDPILKAEEVKHGHWRYDEALELEWCSECGFGKRKGDKRWYSYCPNCGAYMEADDETD